jgi:hypothetical protein
MSPETGSVLADRPPPEAAPAATTAPATASAPAPATVAAQGERLRVLDARASAERSGWERAWEELASGDVFSHPAYLEQFAQEGEIPLCALFTGEDGGRVLYAFLRRPLTADGCGRPVPEGWWDVYTALLYGGPLTGDLPPGADPARLLSAFWESFRAWARSAGAVSEFIRTDPADPRTLSYPGTVREQAPHVVRDLRTCSLEALRADMRSNVRRGVARARAEGLTVVTDTDGHMLADFMRIYAETMDRAGAAVWGTTDRAETARRFWPEFDAWAVSQGAVSEVVRLSLFDDVLLGAGRVRPRLVNYVHELPGSAEALWAAVAPKVRQNVRRARRSGVTVRIDRTGEALGDFLRIYAGTMSRRDSEEWYRFDRSFFERLQCELPGRFAYVCAVHEGETVSADLVLLGADAAYYFLGGTDVRAFPLRANELVKIEAMEFARREGRSAYVLGGGVANGDGLDRYKRGFAPDGARMFCTGERIRDPRAYAELAEERSPITADGDYFPRYRGRARCSEEATRPEDAHPTEQGTRPQSIRPKGSPCPEGVLRPEAGARPQEITRVKETVS